MQHSTTQPRIAAITQQTIINKALFVIAIAVFGVLSLLAGVIRLVSAIIPFLSTSIFTLATSTITDASFELFLGVLILISSRAFAKGKFLAVWIYGTSIVMDGLYKLIMGYPLNYLFMGFGLFMIWQMLKSRDQWETV